DERIINDEVTLRYLSGSCRFSSVFDTDEWLKTPGESNYHFSVPLDNMYHFYQVSIVIVYV
ncbi:TPA: hypothetical protein ACIWG5_004343, partial [Salmonella enterica subsp. enterica serovar Paratyphi A]